MAITPTLQIIIANTCLRITGLSQHLIIYVHYSLSSWTNMELLCPFCACGGVVTVTDICLQKNIGIRLSANSSWYLSACPMTSSQLFQVRGFALLFDWFMRTAGVLLGDNAEKLCLLDTLAACWIGSASLLLSWRSTVNNWSSHGNIFQTVATS